LVNAESLLTAFRRRFSGFEPTVLVRAPGRVNMIGEHVDYNDGLVLPIAIDRATYTVAGRSNDDRIHVFSAAASQTTEFDVHKERWCENPFSHRAHGGAPPVATGWETYPRGVAAELAKAGVRPVGTRIYVDTDLPVGAGLSSSAALEVAVALSLLAAAGATIPPPELARVCRRAEHHYVGVPCGIMDQYACMMAGAGSALLLDCRDEQAVHIPWPDSETVVLIIDSRCRHKLSDGTYAERVHECSLAVERFKHADPAVRSLRDVTPRQLLEQQPSMEDVIYRRARHVVSEIQRTREAAEALKHGDFAAFGRSINESHDSLCNDYEVSSPQLDDLADAVRDVPGVYGARMTGAGFGGCVVAVAPRAAVPPVESAVRKCYDTKYGINALVFVTRPCRGAVATMIERP